MLKPVVAILLLIALTGCSVATGPSVAKHKTTSTRAAHAMMIGTSY
ncbi:MAG: hypothetical protein HZA66_20890 [Rhodopseudomonas palustris]|uniref:Lipoprotein n=1 Tax=Rhodopseudomonas palustris TaxID=1076 RepID=A0A933S048_RHOPL|nr:hypothetical protein [Rhodopseudomonas palustris]